jgi:hypothetical protein
MPTSSEWEGYYTTSRHKFCNFFSKKFGTKLGNSVFPLYIISKILLEKFDKFSISENWGKKEKEKKPTYS